MLLIILNYNFLIFIGYLYFSTTCSDHIQPSSQLFFQSHTSLFHPTLCPHFKKEQCVTYMHLDVWLSTGSSQLIKVCAIKKGKTNRQKTLVLPLQEVSAVNNSSVTDFKHTFSVCGLCLTEACVCYSCCHTCYEFNMHNFLVVVITKHCFLVVIHHLSLLKSLHPIFCIDF